jgi:hypothetical protein
MMLPQNATLLLALGSLCLSGCATDPNALVVKEGYHRHLAPISSYEASQISTFLLNTPFAVPATAPLTCEGIVQALNAQLAKEDKHLRIQFEFSLANKKRLLLQLAKPLTTWQGEQLDETQIREQLSAASMSAALDAVSAQLGLQLLWHSGTVILSDSFGSL